MSTEVSDAVERLCELTVQEETAVACGAWEELLEIQAAQQDALDALPADLPVSVLPSLEAALARSRSTQAQIVGAMAETKGLIERVRSGRRTVGAYGQRDSSVVETRA